MAVNNPGNYPAKRVKNPIAPAEILTPADWKFVEEYLLDLDHERAAFVAGFAQPATAGLRLLNHGPIKRAIRQAMAFRSSRTAVMVDHVLRRWYTLATADANELVQLRLIACRYCHGIDGRKQFTDAELTEASIQHRRAMMKLPEDKRTELDEMGGGGYRTDAAPNPDCGQCSGEGIPHVVFRDTRYLSEAGRVLYDGVERTANGGIKLRFRDRNFAETMVAKHLGMLPKERETIQELDPSRMTPDQLDTVMNALPPKLREAIETTVASYELEDLSPPNKSK